MMRTNKKYCLFIVLSIAILATNLTGCQLAIDEEVMNRIASTDTLVGAFVTIGDINDQIPEDVTKIIEIPKEKLTENSNGTFTINDYLFHDTKYEGYLSNDEIVKFDGIKGYYMGLHSSIDKNGVESTGTMSDDKFHDSFIKVILKDKVNENILEETLSASMNLHEGIYMNPVYLRSDGTYYTIRGYSIYTLGSTPNSTYSMTIDNTLTHTEDGVSDTNKYTFKLNVIIVEEVKQIFIKEMNRNNELIKVTEYFQDDPEEYTVNSNTEYIIVEDIMSNDLNETIIKRSIYNIDQDKLDDIFITHPCNFSEEDNILGGKSIRFIG